LKTVLNVVFEGWEPRIFEHAVHGRVVLDADLDPQGDDDAFLFHLAEEAVGHELLIPHAAFAGVKVGT